MLYTLYRRHCFQYVGDVAFRIYDAIYSVKRRALQKVDEASLEETQIYVCDINPNMLNVGRQRAAERGETSYVFLFVYQISILLFIYSSLYV